jgi:hypothetical protein
MFFETFEILLQQKGRVLSGPEFRLGPRE